VKSAELLAATGSATGDIVKAVAKLDSSKKIENAAS